MYGPAIRHVWPCGSGDDGNMAPGMTPGMYGPPCRACMADGSGDDGQHGARHGPRMYGPAMPGMYGPADPAMMGNMAPGMTPDVRSGHAGMYGPMDPAMMGNMMMPGMYNMTGMYNTVGYIDPITGTYISTIINTCYTCSGTATGPSSILGFGTAVANPAAGYRNIGYISSAISGRAT